MAGPPPLAPEPRDGCQVISDKAAFRARARASRRAFLNSISADERRALELALAARAVPLLTNARVVASYVPMGGEVDPWAIVGQLGDREITLPWFASRAAPMQFRAAAGKLEPGPFGTQQPREEARILVPDALLVPLVAADASGNRVGQGMGHFDRTLAGLRAAGLVAAVGLAWDVQIFDRLPVDSWDERLDAVVTPTRVLRT